MDCREARRVLWPPERLRVVGGAFDEAQVHLRACECCQEYLRQDAALLELYHRLGEAPAPLSVRHRVFDALAAARWGAEARRPADPTEIDSAPRPGGPVSRLPSHGAWPALMAAVLAVVVIGELQKPAIEPSAVFVEDYLRRAVGQEHIETSDPLEVRRFLERELGLRVEPLQMAGFDLARAEICLLEGRRGAMIVYKAPDRQVSHYLVPREGAGERPPAVSTTAGGDLMPVVTWSSARVEQALVGEMTAEELLGVAARSLR